MRGSATRGRCCATTPLGPDSGRRCRPARGGRCAPWWRTRAWSTAGRPAAYAVSAPTTTPARTSNGRASPRPTCSPGWTRGPRTSCRRWRSPRPTSTCGSSSRTPPGRGRAGRAASATRRRSTRSTRWPPPAVSVPPAAETWIHAELAADGVDELLMGFVPRRRSGLELPEPRTVVVRTTDTRQAWTLRAGDGRTTSSVGEPAEGAPADVELLGHRGPGLPRPLEPRRRGHLHRPGPARALAFGRAGALVARPRDAVPLDGHEQPHRPLSGRFSSCCPSRCPPWRSRVDEVPLEDRPEPRREVVVAGLDHRRHPHDVARRGQPDELRRRQRPS